MSSPRKTLAPSEHLALALAVAAFALLAGALAWRTFSQLALDARVGGTRYGMQDFRDAVYFPAIAVLDGHNPYDVELYRATYPVYSPFGLYLPSSLLAYLPFAMLPPLPAAVTFFVTNLALLLLLAHLILRLCGSPSSIERVLFVASLLLVSRPGHSILFLGQNSLLPVIGVYLTFLGRAERPWLSGVGLFLASMKPTFGLPLGVLMLCAGHWGAAFRGVALGAVTSGVMAVPLVRSAGGIGPFVASVLANPKVFSSLEFNRAVGGLRIDVGALLERWGVPPPIGSLAGVAILLLAGLALRRLAGSEDRRARPLAWALTSFAILGSLYHQGYDTILLSSTLAALLSGMWAIPGRAVLVVLTGVPLVNYVSSFAVVHALDLTPAWRLAVASVNGVCIAAAVAVLLMGQLLRGAPEGERTPSA